MGDGQWAIDEEGLPAEIDIPGFAEQNGAISDFRDLDVWNLGFKLATSIYHHTGKFPREELYGLTSQMRRAGVSIPANIAEGYGRNSSGSYIHFLKIALGSTRELETLLEISCELRFLSSEDAQALIGQAQRIAKMLVSLARAIELRRR